MKVANYLKDKLDGAADPNSLTVRQFGGGAANLTYLIKYPKHEYVLRRPPLGPVAKSSHDMGREYKVLSKLYQVFIKAPRAFAFEETGDLIGSQFFIMERRNGIVIRRKIPDQLETNDETGIKISESLIDTLVELHKVDYNSLGLSDLGHPEGFVERQIEGWYRRWNAAKLKESEQMDQVYHWLKNNVPDVGTQFSLIHNDYKLDNVMLNPDDLSQIKAVFDWDMCTLGDPLCDLGALLAYWNEPNDPPYFQGLATMPTKGITFSSREDLVKRYAMKSGRKLSDINFYHCLGLFRVVVIVAQIYYRYVKGQTQDKRFEAFGPVIPGIIQAAHSLIE